MLLRNVSPRALDGSGAKWTRLPGAVGGTAIRISGILSGGTVTAAGGSITMSSRGGAAKLAGGRCDGATALAARSGQEAAFPARPPSEEGWRQEGSAGVSWW